MASASGRIGRLRDHVEATEPTVRALLPEGRRWTRVGGAVATAPPGPLQGMLVVVKETIGVDGLRMGGGAGLDPQTLGLTQGPAVDRLLGAGAVVLGGGVSTALAFADPGPTRNPLDPRRTPGGSSSGSAAAVAAGYCSMALGTQTVDSITTPAAYCGIVGWKPTGGRIPLDGVLPFSPSMDHVGLLAVDVATARLGASVLVEDWRERADTDPAHLLIPTGRYLANVEPAAAASFHSTVGRLRAVGVTITEADVVDDLDAIVTDHRRLTAAEFAAVMEPLVVAHPGLLRPLVAGFYRQGLQVDDPGPERDRAEGLRRRLVAALDDGDAGAFLAPAAMGPAPIGLEFIGSPDLSVPWTHARLPTIAIPSGRVDGMPVGVQLVGRPDRDEELFTLAAELVRRRSGAA